MRIKVLTLFPSMFEGFLLNSIIKRAIASGVFSIELIDIREYSDDKNKRVDSPPTGGGAGLVMRLQPIVSALKANKGQNSRVILLSPRGATYRQEKAHELTNYEELIIICGHYEGIDERILKYVDEIISIGDYILTGGELGAMILIDSTVRLIEGAINSESTLEESYEEGLLEYPQFTEPYEFEGQCVPKILYSGNHEAIRKWRRKESLILTKAIRPDLFDKYNLSKQDKKLLEEVENPETPKWEKEALEKGKKFTNKD